MLKASLTKRDLGEFLEASPAWLDEYWTLAAVHIIKKHRPNLLLVHLLNVDAINHGYGPKAWPSYTSFAYADACLREILNAPDIAQRPGRQPLMAPDPARLTRRSLGIGLVEAV